MSKSHTMEEFNRIQAEKFAKHSEKLRKETEEKEKIQKQEEDKLRLAQEEQVLKEMQYYEEYNLFLSQLETQIIGIESASDIIEIGMYVNYFRQSLETNKHFIDDSKLASEIGTKVTNMIDNVSRNSNSKFVIDANDQYKDASTDITNNIKQCLKLVNYDESALSIELMDTENDIEFAKNLQTKIYTVDDEEYAQSVQSELDHIPFPKRRRIRRGRNVRQYPRIHVPTQPNFQQSVPTQPNFQQSVPNNNFSSYSDFLPTTPSIDMSLYSDFEPFIPNIESDPIQFSESQEDNSVTQFQDFPKSVQEIEDPDLIQLMMYQEEFV